MFYNKDGNIIELEDWKNMFEDNRRIRLTYLPNGYRISTVWLGLDYNFGIGSPFIFETMVFKDDSWMDLDCKRYSTEEEAIKGHKMLVKKWRKKGEK